ncbi:MAG: twin-arginine translocase subunit TatC [Planctomycetota bacterium]|nr:twin-arginine translocase subunit TatC [Planctomycetota bacterium]
MDRPDESLFEETKMSFGDHIEELRSRLFKAVIGVVLGFLLGLYFANHVVIALQQPLRTAISEFKSRQSKSQSQDTDIYADEERNDRNQPFEAKKVRLRPVELAANSIGHLSQSSEYPFRFNAKAIESKNTFRELCQGFANPQGDRFKQAVWNALPSQEQSFIRDIGKQTEHRQEDYQKMADLLNGIIANQRIFEGGVADELESALPGYAKKDTFSGLGRRQHLLASAYSPYLAVPGSETIELTMLIPARNETIATAIQGPFMIWLKTGFVVGLLISAPWVFYQIWAFIAAGLYPHEKRYVHLYLPISLFLFVFGAAFAFYVVFQYVLDFLFQFNASMGVSPDPRVNEYIGFVMILPLGFGVAFQLPIVMVFLNHFGIVSIQTFLSKWRIAILVIAFASMMLTPQDPISMVLMAIPLAMLYFIGIMMCKFMPKGRNRFSEAAGYDPS